MMNEPGLRRSLPDQSSGSGRTFSTPRHQSVADPILSKRVCFYKSGDPQFSGLSMVINNRTFKTFDALLDSLSKKVPLPFGVRNITTPHGVHAVHTLDELEDGKSYICSDMRKAKPIDLALVRRKPPPWYHARPVSSRRRTVHQSRSKVDKKERAVLRTPKRLLVFCNGAPTVQHTLVLDKRITPTFESLLEYISEVIQLHVVKLHTLDGRRVDGLSGLILCSGVVVAAGREPFRPANYNAQNSAALTSHQASLRRLKSLSRKKKLLSYNPMSRKFSASSERYIVNRIHDSIAESSFDLPSNHTNSASLESGRLLASVAEDDMEAQDAALPTEDDIEKSFRVNQDGSMTVEMKVRLTIKEEETIQWTTTLSRSSVANQTNESSLPALEAEQLGSVTSPSLDLQSPSVATDAIKNDKSEDDEEPLPQCNGALSDSIDEDAQMSPHRTLTPRDNHIRQKQVSVESITSVSEGTEDGTLTSFSYTEQTEDVAVTEQYCMFKQKSTRPVPKPRRFGSVDGSSRMVSTFESAGMAEFLQVESSGDAVTETVLHIYEQQTCQDNFLANASGNPWPGEPQPWRPSTASESISMWRTESMSMTSDLGLPTVKTTEIQETGLTQGTSEVGQDKRITSTPKVTHKRRHIVSPGNRRKEKSAEKRKKQKQVKALTSGGVLKKSYGNKLRSIQSTKLRKQTPQKDNKTSGLKENRQEMKNKKDDPDKSSESTHQPSVHQGRRSQSEEEPSPTFNSSASATNKYVEKWLEQSHQQAYGEEESKRVQVAKVVKQLETTSETQASQAPRTDLFPDNVRRASVKQRILSFENRLSNPSGEKMLTTQQNHGTDATLCNISDQNNLGEPQPVSNHCCPEKTSTESESRSHLIKISLHNATPSPSLSMDLPSPPTSAEITELLNDGGVTPSETSDTFSRVSSGARQVSDQPLSSSPPSDKLISSVDQIFLSETTTSTQPDGSSTPLSRSPSTKRVPLVSNFSFDRKMSLRKARLDKYAVSCDETPSAPNNTMGETVLPNVGQTGAMQLTSKAPMQEDGTSRSSSVYPATLESEERMSTGSLSSVQTPQSSEKDASPKSTVINVNRGSSLSPETKSQTKRISSELTHDSPDVSSKHKNSKMVNVIEEKHMTPNTSSSAKKKQVLPEPELQYSQCLDAASPPLRQEPGKMLPLNHSADKQNGTHRSSKGMSEQPPQSISNQTENLVRSQPYSDANQANMKPVLDQLCYSMKSIRQMLQDLERPDFSSHVASMFGSSSKMLLAFLSIMTLEGGVTHRYRDELNANAVSCAEALKMIDSLRETAAIEDSHQLKDRLLSLQHSASQQLLESWKRFLELSDKSRSCSSKPDSKQEFGADAPERGSRDIINEIMDDLDIPDELKDELASLPEITSNNSKRIRDAGGVSSGNVTTHEAIDTPSIQEGGSEVESHELQIQESETVPKDEESGSEEETQEGAAPGEEPEVESVDKKRAGEGSSDSEEEQSALTYYVELNARTSSMESDSTSLSRGFSEMTSPSMSDQERLNQTGHTEVEASGDDSDMEEPASQEELAEDESMESKALVKNVFEEKESEEEAEKEDINQHLHTRKDRSSLVIDRQYSSDEDSRNDHNNCETNADIKTSKVSSSMEEEIRYYEKDLSSEEEKTCENVAKPIQDPPKEVISQTIAERVSQLEKQVADAQRTRNTTVKCSTQGNPHRQSDGESESPASESLSFSYDSSSFIMTEPERTRVKSIREMFLAKGTTNSKQGNRSQPPDRRAETSVSGGYQSQTSSDTSSAEDESAQKPFSKGFVRRTIERLYGKKDVSPEQEAGERPPSAPKHKKKNQSRGFSPFHNARSKAGSELSYYSSTNTIDTLNETAKCVAFNTQVRPGDSIPSEDGQWSMRKSVSDPVGINQGVTTAPEAEEASEDTEEKTPYSLFELKDKNSLQRKCTYFSLPHTSESDVCQEEPSTVSRVAANSDAAADAQDQLTDSKTRLERNGTLPAVGITDFKKMDNKVHPLVELPPDGEVVVVAQPVRGHGVVNRRVPEPDVLDLLYNFCGQNCPIL